MAKHHHLHLAVTVLVIATIITTTPSTASASSSPPPTAASPPAPAPPPPPPPPPTPTAYEMLEQYNLSRGILPEGVTGYDLRPDGSFEVYLPGDCSIRAGKMTVRYSSLVVGNIQSQWIRDLKGVKVRVLLTWIAINEVNRTEDKLNFFAGPLSKSFPNDKFAKSRKCV